MQVLISVDRISSVTVWIEEVMGRTSNFAILFLPSQSSSRLTKASRFSIFCTETVGSERKGSRACIGPHAESIPTELETRESSA